MNLCVIGTGYVGLVSAACLAEMGNDVCCVDINDRVVEQLNQGFVHIFEPGLEELVKRNASQSRLVFTTDVAEGIRNALFIFITVGTPPCGDGSCDLSHVFDAARSIGQHMQEYKIIVDKSTVPVGTADQVGEIIRSELAGRGLDLEFDVVSNPEFLKEGDAVQDFLKPDRIIVGTDNVRVAELLKALYSPFARSREKLIVMGVRSAEMTKYAANCMLATKISFINEMANICERVGADVSEVRLGMGSDHRIGHHFIYPGVGYGGSCFPKDVKALIRTALSHGYRPEVLESIDTLNCRQKGVLGHRIAAYFEPYGGVSGKVLALWGLAFKPNTDDVREAPSLELIKEVTSRGMIVQAYDPVAGPKVQEACGGNGSLRIVEKQYAALEGADALAIVTEWNQFRNPDFDRIKEALKMPVIFDGRNLYMPQLLHRMGFTYFSIGRPVPG
ncbi:MAG: UDP-glucose/GDP-mannose dehydrogenase family protein [Pseudomonadota bacterium]